MSRKFVRNVEDFVCDNCKAEIKGNGYTNHCPFCLYSKHVDINPGDRQSNCKGLMKPINIEHYKSKYVIIFCCMKCGITKRNKTAENDNFEKILATAKANIMGGKR